MRIVDEGIKQGVRYTIFINNDKYGLKLEYEQVEMHYKFRHGEVRNAGELKSKLHSDFFKEAIERLQAMVLERANLCSKLQDVSDLPHII